MDKHMQYKHDKMTHTHTHRVTGIHKSTEINKYS